MKLVNTRDRSFNGIKMGEEVELKEQAQIDEYLEAGFEKAGKEEIKAVVKDAEVKKEAGKEEVK
jgi:hypothetical protein